jgi:hypothetical protein
MKDLVRFFLVLLLATYSFAQSESTCEYVYGDWSECINSFQNRTVSCVCAGVTADDKNCVDFQVLPLIQDCVEYKNCFWKWSRWTACSEVCDGGNTTRVQQCFCDEIMTPVPDDKCDADYLFGRETVPCNEFTCKETPALNKLYWISKDETTTWPIENKTFNCSQGYDDDEDSPAGKTYSQVLSDPYPATHKHYEWYFLAKEWICAQLNLANGVVFSPAAMEVIDKAGALLENCAGFSEEQVPTVYALKEKLGRLNNNIGGLENVDEQVSLMSSGHDDVEDPESSLSRMTFILAIAVPLAAVVITAIALALTIYYVRDKTTVAKEEFESEDEEEPLQNTTGNDVRTDNQVPLEMEQVPTTRDESTSEEQI